MKQEGKRKERTRESFKGGLTVGRLKGGMNSSFCGIY